MNKPLTANSALVLQALKDMNKKEVFAKDVLKVMRKTNPAMTFNGVNATLAALVKRGLLTSAKGPSTNMEGKPGLFTHYTVIEQDAPAAEAPVADTVAESAPEANA